MRLDVIKMYSCVYKRFVIWHKQTGKQKFVCRVGSELVTVFNVILEHV